MTDQHGAGGLVGRPDPSGGTGTTPPGPLSPAGEEPARPSGPPATGGSAPSAHGATAPGESSGPWAGWHDREGHGGSTAAQSQSAQPQSGQPQSAQSQSGQSQPAGAQPGPGQQPSAPQAQPPTEQQSSSGQAHGGQPAGLQTAGTPAPNPGAGPGGSPGGSTTGGNPWGDYPDVEHGGPRRHPSEIFPAPSGVTSNPGRSVDANRTGPVGSAPSGSLPPGSASSASLGSTAPNQGSDRSSYGSAPSGYGSGSGSYGSGTGSSAHTSGTGTYDSAAGTYGGGASAYGTGAPGSSASASTSYQQQPSAPSGYSGQPTQPVPAQPVPADPSGQPVPPGGPDGPGRSGRSSRRHFLATAGIAAATAIVVGGGAGLAGSALGRSVGPGTETDPPDGGGPSPTQEPGEAVGAAVAAKVLPSTVTILVNASSGDSSGSGFVLNADGMIMTNNHVVDSAADSGRITVLFEDGSRANAEVVGRSPSYDIGVIKVDTGGTELVPSELGNSDEVKVGDLAIALGAPLGLGGSVTQGIISARNRPVAVGSSAEDASFMNALQTDAPINPGNSGGPLADGTGKIIGVNSAILSNATGDQRPGSIGIGFAIPITQAKVIADQIMETGHATYPTAGVQVTNAGNRQGARVVQLEPGSPAASAGLEEDDVVIKIDGRPVTTMVEFIVAVRSHRPGDEVTVTYNRSGTPEETKVTLGEEQG